MRSARLPVLCAVLSLQACDRLPASQDAPTLSARDIPTAQGPETPASPAPIETPSHLSQQPSMEVPGARPEKPGRAAAHTPPPGSADRVALMNALRAVVRHDIGGDVVFVVRALRMDGDWAFAVVEPTWPDGRRIVAAATPLHRAQTDKAALDGLRTEAIWRRQNGRWRVIAHAIGATDAWWLAHCGPAPSGLMPGC